MSGTSREVLERSLIQLRVGPWLLTLPFLIPAPLNVTVWLEFQQSFSLMRGVENGNHRLAVKQKHWTVQMATNSSHPLTHMPVQRGFTAPPIQGGSL